jgi:hypothetical protein
LPGYPVPTQRFGCFGDLLPRAAPADANSEPALPKKLDEGGQLGSGLASALIVVGSKAGSPDSPS